MTKPLPPFELKSTLTVRTLKDHWPRMGYDDLKAVQSAMPAIVETKARESGMSTGDFTIWVASSARELVDQMSAELDLRAYYMGASAGVAGKLLSTFETSQTSFYIVARQQIEARNQTISDQKLELTEEARQKLEADPGGFHARYGGYYCHTVVLGGALYVAYQCVTTSVKRATDISAKIDVSVPDVGSLMASVGKVMSEETTNTSWQMNAHNQGAGGMIGDYDPRDPDSVRKAVMDFMREFEEKVRANPEPYYGEYNGYWRMFDAPAFRAAVTEATDKVEVLSDWATGYADADARIKSFLDPKSSEGYRVTDAMRKKIEAVEARVKKAWKALRDSFDDMERLEEFRFPTELEGVAAEPPDKIAGELDNIRTELLAHYIKMGQSMIVTLSEAGRHLHDSGDTLAGEGPDEAGPHGEPDGALTGSAVYVRLSKSASTRYVLKPVDKKVGEFLCHDDIVNLVHDGAKAFKGWMIYMPDRWGVWTAWLDTYDKGDHKKYEWRVKIEKCKDKTRRVTTEDTLWLTNLNDETCYLCVHKSPDYLGVTRSETDEWKIKLSH